MTVLLEMKTTIQEEPSIHKGVYAGSIGSGIGVESASCNAGLSLIIDIGTTFKRCQFFMNVRDVPPVADGRGRFM